MTKKVIWVLLVTESGQTDYVGLFATYAQANEAARDALKESWNEYCETCDKGDIDMPADYGAAIDAMHADDYFDHASADITHYTIDTDALADA